MNGAEAILHCLKSEGVEVVFGYPGGVLIPLYDALHKVDIRHVLVRNEQGASFAAGGYARATGKVGCCFATSGPGATNLVTGIADAYMDSVPIVCLTGQVSRPAIGKDSFQESDVTGITLPIVKHSYLVQSSEELPWVMHEAFHIARSGRPGPVVIDMPKDVTTAPCTVPLDVPVDRLRGTVVTGHPDLAQIAQAAAMIDAASRPTLYVGHGCLDSRPELLAFCEKTGIPVCWTLLGKSAMPEDHPLAVGMIGMHGAAYANYAITRSDLMIVIGARFDDRVTGKVATFNPDAKVIHIDIDAAELGKMRQPTIGIRSDATGALRALTEHCHRIDRAGWQGQINEWKEQYPLVPHAVDAATGEIRPQHLLDKLTQATEGKALLATDVGQHQMWAAQFYRPKDPRLFLTSGGLGAMGFGLPAAIGAWFGRPDKEVWLVTGDGSIQMNIQELATAVIEKAPVKVMLINNGYLGMVRQWQELFYAGNYSETWLHTVPTEKEPWVCPDFVKLFEAYGAKGRRIMADSDVDAAIDWARTCDGPVLLEFVVHEEENVWPMVPAGGDTGKPILEPDEP